MLIGSLSLVAVGLYSYNVQQTLLYKVSNEKLMIMMKIIKKHKREQYRLYRANLFAISQEQDFISNLLTHDMKKIKTYLLNKQNILFAADANFYHFHLYNSKGRMYNLGLEEEYENHSANNPVLNLAMKNVKMTQGYVDSLDTSYYYSIVKPIFKGEEVLGYLEVGINAEAHIKLASKIGRYKYALYINKENRQNGLRNLGEQIMSNSKLFDELNINQKFIYKYANQNIIVKHESKYYLINQYDIETSEQEDYAQNILANNVTTFVLENYSRAKGFALFSVVILFVMYLIMYFYIGKFIKKLQEDEVILLSQKDEMQLIMDNSENFVLVYENYKLVSVNKPFLYFFNITNLNVFIKRHDSIEMLFEDSSDTFVCKYLPNIKWMDEIHSLDVTQRVVALKHQSSGTHYFSVKCSVLNSSKNLQIVSFSEITTLYQGAKKDQYNANHDTLTKIYNRKYFNEFIHGKINKVDKEFSTLSLLMIDIDFFKKVNDKFGHQTGDYVLVHLCELVMQHIRVGDLFARWGGEEFVVLLSDTSETIAIEIAEKICSIIETSVFEKVGNITCSIGVSEYKENDDIHSLIARTDEALYEAKANGRNRVEVSS